MADLSTLQDMISNLTTTVNSIKDDVQGFQTSKSKLTEIVPIVEEDSMKVKLLSVIVIRQDSRIQHLEEVVKGLVRNAKKAGLLIQGLEEIVDQPKKDRIELVQSFFKEKMEISEAEIGIKNAYWGGQGEARHMYIELEDHEDKAIIFDNVSKLKGKKNARRKLYYVNNEITDEEKEHRNYYRSLLRENNTYGEEEKLKIHLKRGKLLVNNVTIMPQIQAPKPNDVLTLEPSELEEIHSIRTHQTEVREERGSEFICRYQKVKSVADVQKGLAKMKIKFGDAAHTVAAYRLESPKGPFNQGFQNDGEFGAGWRMLQELKDKGDTNIAVFVARFTDGTKMGPRRFDVYKEMVQKAVKGFRMKMKRLDRTNRLRRSQSQTSMLSIDDMENMDEQDILTTESTEPLHQEIPV